MPEYKGVFIIGAFQLENLVMGQVPFKYYDVRKKPDKEIPENAKKYLKGSQTIDAKELLENKEQLLPELHTPVVLVCEKAKISTKLGVKLVELGYNNVYVLQGGIKKLG